MGTPTRRTRLPTHVSDSLPKLAKPTQPLECYWTKEPTSNPPSQNTPTRTVETCTTCCLCCTGQTDGLRRSDRWTEGQAGGYSRHTTSVPESLNDFSRPWNKNTPKTQPARKENLLTPKIGTGRRLICGPNLVTNPVQ
jgi:hypothetical protein